MALTALASGKAKAKSSAFFRLLYRQALEGLYGSRDMWTIFVGAVPPGRG